MKDNQNISKLEIIKDLEHGTFGSTYKVKHTNSNSIHSIRKIKSNQIKEENLKKIKNETKILSSLNNLIMNILLNIMILL